MEAGVQAVTGVEVRLSVAQRFDPRPQATRDARYDLRDDIGGAGSLQNFLHPRLQTLIIGMHMTVDKRWGWVTGHE